MVRRIRIPRNIRAKRSTVIVVISMVVWVIYRIRIPRSISSNS